MSCLIYTIVHGYLSRGSASKDSKGGECPPPPPPNETVVSLSCCTGVEQRTCTCSSHCTAWSVTWEQSFVL